MRKLRRHLFITVHALMLLVMCAGQTLSQASPDDLLKQRLTVKIDEDPFITVLATLSVEHRIPIGLELGTVSYDGFRRSIDVTNVPLEHILNLICQNWPAYRWEVTDGVVNFVPLSTRDPLVVQLLTTRINHFSPGKGIDKFELRNSILDLLEVKNFLKANDISTFRLGDPARTSDNIGDVDLSVSYTDVKGILNKVIRESDRKFWVVSHRPQETKTIQISF
jgi:hypothetical protein